MCLMPNFACCVLFIVFLNVIISAKGASSQPTKCIENGRFYRDPDRNPQELWATSECAKYFLCLEGEVFEFRCSSGLLFDVYRQICDFKLNVENCDIATEAPSPEPLLGKAACADKKQWGCADGTCLPREYFCDGAVDCSDGSDEGHCDMSNDPLAVGPCDATVCQLPECFCSKDGTRIPGDLNPADVPQMIILTFDDAINADNFDLYSKVLFTPERRNPNGCPIQATFFVSHQYNNYHQTQKLWNGGHEIAVHSITHRGPEDWWSFNATLEDWFDEMVGQANILHKFGQVRLGDITGLRVPFLRVGWNRQFLMMQEFGFVYDSSLIAPFRNPPLWPYTMDYKIPHKCTGMKQNCPTRSYPGLWEMVMNQLEMDGFTCAMVDSCPTAMSGEEVYRMLMHNFKRHYLSNRAPFGLYFHSTWFKRPDYSLAFQRFMDDILQQEDVWFVTNYQAIQWMRNATKTQDIYNFKPWDCQRTFNSSELACKKPNVCKLYSQVFQQDRYFRTCTKCPSKYPWLRNEFGFE